MNTYHFQIYKSLGDTVPHSRVKVVSVDSREDVLAKLRRMYPGHQIYSYQPAENFKRVSRWKFEITG